MREGQTIFPYVLVTEKDSYIKVLESFVTEKIASGLGVYTFRSKADFSEIYDALKNEGSGFALIQAYDMNYFGDGNFARVFGNLN